MLSWSQVGPSAHVAVSQAFQEHHSRGGGELQLKRANAECSFPYPTHLPSNPSPFPGSPLLSQHPHFFPDLLPPELHFRSQSGMSALFLQVLGFALQAKSLCGLDQGVFSHQYIQSVCTTMIMSQIPVDIKSSLSE